MGPLDENARCNGRIQSTENTGENSVSDSLPSWWDYLGQGKVVGERNGEDAISSWFTPPKF